jgi:hypothetical protein
MCADWFRRLDPMGDALSGRGGKDPHAVDDSEGPYDRRGAGGVSTRTWSDVAPANAAGCAGVQNPFPGACCGRPVCCHWLGWLATGLVLAAGNKPRLQHIVVP